MTRTRYTLPVGMTFDEFVAEMRPPDVLLVMPDRIPEVRQWQILWSAFLADAEAQDTHEEGGAMTRLTEAELREALANHEVISDTQIGFGL